MYFLFLPQKWPKLRSRLRVWGSYELWKGHMKEVEGHFGSTIVSYFIFLRWLFLMNVIIFALWVGFVVVPNVVYIIAEQPALTTSRLACAFNSSTSVQFICPDESMGIPPVCNGSFEVRECVAEPRTANESVVVRESGAAPLLVECSAVDPSLRLCVGGVDPSYSWYQYIFDLVLGQGLFNDTLLFYGRYSNNTGAQSNGYNLSLAYLITAFVVYGVSLLLLVFK